MKLTFKSEDMYSALDKFDVGYSYPVSAVICNMTGFFASKKNLHSGFVALSERNSLIIADYNMIMQETLYEIPMASIKSLKIGRKALLVGTQTIKIEFLSEGKKFRFDISIAPKIIGGDFNEQEENMGAIISELQNYL